MMDGTAQAILTHRLEGVDHPLWAPRRARGAEEAPAHLPAPPGRSAAAGTGARP